MIHFIKINKKTILVFIIGFSIGITLTILLRPDAISQLKNGEEKVVSIDNYTITADTLYESLKNMGSVYIIINEIDAKILDNLYETTDEMIEEVTSEANYYLNTASNYYGYSVTAFLSSNGFTSFEDFKNNLILEYKRNLYLTDYLKKEITEEEIKNFYNNLTGAMSGKYILIDDLDTTKKILADLKSGKTYSEIINAYNDKINIKALKNIEFDSNIEDEIYEELKNLEVNSYSNNYFNLNDKYVVVFKDDEIEKASLKDLNERIKIYLAEEKINQDDGTIANEILNDLREKYNLHFFDTSIEKEYLNYLR